MKILGLNGWTERGHDAGATLIIDGKLISSIEEEKIINKRHAFDTLPIESIKFVLKEGKINLDDLDKIVFGWDYEYLFNLLNQKFISKEEFSQALFGSKKYAEKIEFVTHHLAHAYSTFIPSNYEKALVLVVDGQGEVMGTSIYEANRQDKTMRLLMETPISLGYFYAAGTKHIGLNLGEEGKLMGLSAYGKPTYYNKLKKHLFVKNGELICSFNVNKISKDEEEETIKEWQKLFSEIIPSRENKVILEITKEIPEYANFAKSIQLLLEDILKELITYYYKKTKIKKVTVAGGVGLNCPANSAIENLPFIKEVFVQPAANDGGISLGAAIIGAINLGEDVKIEMIPYLGSEYSTEEIKKELDKLSSKYHFTYEKKKNIEKDIAKLIFEENIVANFQGKLELGPRALGNRSLLASPVKKETLIKMNNLKGREIWRPLAPAVLYEEQKKWFDYEMFSPFMIKNCSVNKNKKKLLEAITHVDDSARIQSVNKEYNEKFYKIIYEFYKLSKIPVLINTSFNIKGKPIVATIEQAIKSVIEMNLDYLAIGDYLVKIDYSKYKYKKIAIASSIHFTGIVPDDLMLQTKLKELGYYAHIVSWEDEKENYFKYAAIVNRSTWDYSKNLKNYQNWLKYLINNNLNVINPADIILTNINKFNQLNILKANNLNNNILTTTLKNEDINNDLSILVKKEIDTKYKNCPAVVIKPFISANAYNTYLIEVKEKLNRPSTVKISDIDKLYEFILTEEDNGIIIQEFMPEIDIGEPSIYCIDKKISHVTRKFTSVFDSSGKITRTFDKSEPLDNLPEKYYTLVKEIIKIPEYNDVSYMRIDFVEREGALAIMEVELADPNFHFKDIKDETLKDEIITNFAKSIIKKIE